MSEKYGTFCLKSEVSIHCKHFIFIFFSGLDIKSSNSIFVFYIYGVRYTRSGSWQSVPHSLTALLPQGNGYIHQLQCGFYPVIKY